jgi:hypothetical protein
MVVKKIYEEKRKSFFMKDKNVEIIHNSMGNST